MLPLWVDCETYSELDLKEVGTARYAATAEPIIITWALGDGPVKVWDLLHHVCTGDLAADAARADIIRAANAPFDRLVLGGRGFLPLDPERWDCLVVRAYRAGWPLGGLDYLCKVLGVPEDQAKTKEGKALMRLFCSPPRARNPAKWRRFIRYAKLDVTALRACWARLPGTNDSEFERATWLFDQRVNDRGWPVDRDSVTGGIRVAEEGIRLVDEALVHRTGGVVKGASDVHGLRRALSAVCGHPVESVSAEALKELIEAPGTPQAARELARLRQEGSRTTNAKYPRLQAALMDDGRVRHMLQYGGASRTLRWAGRVVQPHNLIRPAKGVDPRLVAAMLAAGYTAGELELLWNRPPLEILAYAIRGTFRAPSGYQFVLGDLGQIEARMVNWLAGNKPMLDVFADPEQDPYVYQVRLIGGEDRQLGKVLVLACGFGMAGDTFLEAANGEPYNLGLTLEQAQEAVDGWRANNQPVVGFWWALGDACIQALETRQPQVCRRLLIRVWEYAGIRYMSITLPSGRHLLYPDARLQPGKRGRLQIVYTGMKGATRTYGGKLVENATQAAARDVLVHGMLMTQHMGFECVGHVHDESINLQRVDDTVHTPELLEWCLTRVPEWAVGLPLKAGCKVTERYTK